MITDGVTYRWRAPLTDAEMVDLLNAHGGNAEGGWWNRIRPHSLGWVTARSDAERLVGFVNVVSDDGDSAGCEWLHVDFEPHLAAFYFDACGFRPTDAGLIHLPSSDD